MSALTAALVLAAGVLGALAALWIDHTISLRHAGRASWPSLLLAGGAGLLVALSLHFTRNDPILTAAALAAATALCVAVSTDLRFGRLADLTSLIIAVCALWAAPLLTPGLGYAEMAAAAFTAVGILALAALYGRMRRGEMGLGAGDILLAGALGLWCPIVSAALGVAIGAGLTLISGLLLKAQARTRLPFGPGLAAGFILAFALERLT